MKHWGFNLYKDNQIEDLEVLKQFRADDFNFSDDLLKHFQQNQNNGGGGVQFSITASLDVLRQRMLGAIRRQQRNKVTHDDQRNHGHRKKQQN